MNYNLHIAAHTERGVFEGNVNGEPSASVQDLETIRDRMQEQVLNYMVLSSQGPDGSRVETLLPAAVLETAVLVFSIRAAE